MTLDNDPTTQAAATDCAGGWNAPRIAPTRWTADEPVVDARPASRGPAYFDALYAKDPDPWRFETSPYEQDKYRATLAALPPRRWGRGFEAGCSIGVMTRLLAARCDHLLAVDHAAYAAQTTRSRCADLAHVEVRQASIPDTWPGVGIDLIVLSEVLYFLSAADIARCARLSCERLAQDGLIVLANWRGATGAVLSGDAAADLFVAGMLACSRDGRRPWQHSRIDHDPRYRLDLLLRRVRQAP